MERVKVLHGQEQVPALLLQSQPCTMSIPGMPVRAACLLLHAFCTSVKIKRVTLSREGGSHNG